MYTIQIQLYTLYTRTVKKKFCLISIHCIQTRDLKEMFHKQTRSNEHLYINRIKKKN